MKRKSLFKRLFPFVVLFLLAPWPVAYAFENSGGQPAIQVSSAQTSAQPRWTVFGNAVGKVTPGDLFVIDTTNSTADMPVTLYMTNSDELVHSYRYLILKVGFYKQKADGGWTKGRSRRPVASGHLCDHA